MDPHASMPYILKFQKGQGHHQKEVVRIGVGTLKRTLIVCLPGPHDEVQLAWPVLREGLKDHSDKEVLAKKLRQKFLSRQRHHDHTQETNP